MNPLIILKYWQPILAAIVTAGLAWGLHTISINHLEKKQVKALAAQELTLTKKCDADKKLTEDSDNAYEAKISALGDELARAKRVLPNRCVPVIAGPSVGTHATAAETKHGAGDGVYSDTLLNFAGKCEGYRLQLTGLQDFVHKVWGR